MNDYCKSVSGYGISYFSMDSSCAELFRLPFPLYSNFGFSRKFLWFRFFSCSFSSSLGRDYLLRYFAEVESGRNRYECLIDDTVPFVEVVENYDVVSQRGELWILEDRDEISVD